MGLHFQECYVEGLVSYTVREFYLRGLVLRGFLLLGLSTCVSSDCEGGNVDLVVRLIKLAVGRMVG